MKSICSLVAVAALFILLFYANNIYAFDNTDAASGTRMTSGSLVMDALVGQSVVGISGHLVSGFLGSKAAPKYVPGDADGNGVVAISDAVWIINFIFGGGSPPKPVQAGDADCSGSVAIGDAVFVINFIFGGGVAPHYCP